MATDTGDVIDWLWNGGTVTTKWFWKSSHDIPVKGRQVWCSRALISEIPDGHWCLFQCLPDEKGPCQSLPQLARNYHLQSQKQTFLFFHLSNVWGKSTPIMRYNTKQSAAPAGFSWSITLVPLRKFFPMIKTSSPPLTEQLWRLFFRISGTPAGWAGEWRGYKIKFDSVARLLNYLFDIKKPYSCKYFTWYKLNEVQCLLLTLNCFVCITHYSLQRMGDEETCKVRNDPSGWGMVTLKASLARVLFFLDPATPMRASTSALRSFKIPTQSTLQTQNARRKEK